MTTDLANVSHASKFPAKLRTGLAVDRPPTPAGAGDAYLASNTQVLSISTDGLTWDKEYNMGNIGSVPFIGARAYSYATQPILTSDAEFLSFDTEDYDTNTFHSNSVNPQRLTIQVAGRYTVFGWIVWSSPLAYPTSQLFLQLNNGARIDTLIGCSFSIQTPVLALNDYLRLEAFQASGATRNVIEAFFGLQFLSAT